MARYDGLAEWYDENLASNVRCPGAASIARVAATLEEHGALEFTIIVAATASVPG